MLEIIIHDSTFLLCNVYAPNDNSSQNTFFSNLNNTVKQHTNLQIILGGDLNCALTPLDKTGVLQSEEYTKRGPGFWKINNSLLKDDKFTSELKAKIPEFKAKHNYLEDKGLYWDLLKMEVRGFCVQYSKRENKFRRNADKPEQDKLENPLRSEECYNVLKECAKGKCPGSDGLSVEFYLHFWSLLETNLDTPFCNMLFCTNLLDPVCSLVEQKALRLYHPIRTEYNLWIHSRSSSSPWFEPLFNHRQILYLYCVTKRRGLYLGSFFCYT